MQPFSMDKKALVEGYGRTLNPSRRKYFVLVDYSTSNEPHEMKWLLEVYKSECEWIRRNSPEDRVSLHDLFLVEILHRKETTTTNNGLLFLKESGSYALIIESDAERTRWQGLCQRIIQRNRKEYRYPPVVQGMEARVKLKYDRSHKKQHTKQQSDLCKRLPMFESCRVVFMHDSILLVTTALRQPDLIIAYSEIRNYSSRDDGRMELDLGRGFALGECRARFQLADKVEAHHAHKVLEHQLNSQVKNSRASWRSGRLSTYTDSSERSVATNSRLSNCSSSSSQASFTKTLSHLPQLQQPIDTLTSASSSTVTTVSHSKSKTPGTYSRTSSLGGLLSFFQSSSTSSQSRRSELLKSSMSGEVSVVAAAAAAPCDAEMTDDNTDGNTVEASHTQSSQRSPEMSSTTETLVGQCQDESQLWRSTYASGLGRSGPVVHRSSQLSYYQSGAYPVTQPHHRHHNRKSLHECNIVPPHRANSLRHPRPQSSSVQPSRSFLQFERPSVICGDMMGEAAEGEYMLMESSRKSTLVAPEETPDPGLHTAADDAAEHYLMSDDISSPHSYRPLFLPEGPPGVVSSGPIPGSSRYTPTPQEESSPYCSMVHQLRSTDFYKRAYSWGARPQLQTQTPSTQQPAAQGPSSSEDSRRSLSGSSSSQHVHQQNPRSSRKGGRVISGMEAPQPVVLRNCGHRDDAELFAELPFSRPRTSSDSRAHRRVSLLDQAEGLLVRAVRAMVGGSSNTAPVTTSAPVPPLTHSSGISSSSQRGSITAPSRRIPGTRRQNSVAFPVQESSVLFPEAGEQDPPPVAPGSTSSRGASNDDSASADTSHSCFSPPPSARGDSTSGQSSMEKLVTSTSNHPSQDEPEPFPSPTNHTTPSLLLTTLPAPERSALKQS